MKRRKLLKILGGVAAFAVTPFTVKREPANVFCDRKVMKAINEWEEEKRMCLVEHKRDIDRTFWMNPGPPIKHEKLTTGMIYEFVKGV